MHELSLRCALVSIVALLSACATPPPSAQTPCPTTGEPVASATPAATSSAATPSGDAAPPATATAEPPPRAETVRAPSPRDAAAFNTWLAQHDHAKELPLIVAHAFAGVEARNVGYSVSYASGEAALSATATVTLDGLLDDSVRGEEHVLSFTRDAVDAPWRLTQAKSRVRCWPGRGHADLSAAPCT